MNKTLQSHSAPMAAADVPKPARAEAVSSPRQNRRPQGLQPGRHSLAGQYFLSLGVVLAITIAAFAFKWVFGYHAIALLYLFGVVLLGLLVGRGPTLLAAAGSAMLWDFFFMDPIHSLRLTSLEDGMLLGMYFAVALALGHLTARVRAQQEIERQRQQHATALFLLTRELAESPTRELLSQTIIRQMAATFDATVTLLLPDASNRLRPHSASMFEPDVTELKAATEAFERGERAGKYVNNPPNVGAMFLPLASGGATVEVLGLRFSQKFPLTTPQRELLDASAEQIVLALNRLWLKEVSERANLLAESERLSKALLDSMSHEIRTPIAAIKSATGNLIEFQEAELSPTQSAMIEEIQEATERLNRLVGNVLDITRLESTGAKPKLNECDVRELIHVAVTETEKELARHTLTVDVAPDLPVVRMNFVLMQQVLTNLLSNAAIHTPPRTEVKVSARVERDALLITVADCGPGIHPKAMPRLFEKFQRGPNAPSGGSGLGLSLVKGFVEAHGGRVKAANSPGGGAIFTISLPIDKTTPAQAPAPL